MVGQTSNQNKSKGRPRAMIDDKLLKQLYLEEGLSVRIIGERLGVSHQTIARRLSELDIPLKKWRLPGEYQINPER